MVTVILYSIVSLTAYPSLGALLVVTFSTVRWAFVGASVTVRVPSLSVTV